MSQTFGDRANRELRARIHGAPRAEHLQPHDGRDVDEVARVLFFEYRQRRGDAVQEALDVDVDHPVPLVGLAQRKWRDRHQTSVVHHDVEATMLRYDVADQAVDLVLIRHIDWMNRRVPAFRHDFRGNALKLVDAASGQSDSGAFGGKKFGGGFTNSARSTGNDDDFVCHDSLHEVELREEKSRPDEYF
ncbi:hypothetical protein BC2230_120062 [Burkholderia cepacia]